MGITVRAVASGADLDAALALPDRLHAADPCHVPFLRVVDRRRTRSFLRSGDLSLFVARRDGEVVGSVSVLRDRGHERDKGERVAWFGYFECVDDEVAAALFDQVRLTARGLGCDILRGPRNLTRFDHVGLTVEGHDRLPPFLQGHHPPRYAAHLEARGLAKHHDVLAYEIALLDEQGRPKPLPDGLSRKARECAVPDLVVRPSSRRSGQRDLVAAHEILDQAFRTVPDIAPMPRATFVGMGRIFLAFADPQLLQLATSAGRPVGFAACFPELNEALRDVHGRLLPLGWARLLRGMRRVKTASFKLIGVVPELRGSGLHARLIEGVVDGVRRAGYERLEASVIDERNAPMRAVVEHAGMTVYRRYRFFGGPV